MKNFVARFRMQIRCNWFGESAHALDLVALRLLRRCSHCQHPIQFCRLKNLAQNALTDPSAFVVLE